MLSILSGGVRGDKAEIELHPHTVPLSPGHASSVRGLFVVADIDPVANPWIEGGVIGSGAVADPCFGDEVRAD